jgi:aquaporin Z
MTDLPPPGSREPTVPLPPISPEPVETIPATAPAYDPAPTTPVAAPAEPVAVAGPSNLKLFGAEAVGTCVLMIVGPGSAILAADAIGPHGVAIAFGFALLAMAYTIGHVSGCHINPAVTLSFWLSRKVTLVQAGYYWVAQVVGAVLGGLIVWFISDFGDLDNTGVFASNGWGEDIGSAFGLFPAILVEIFFTALLIFVVLSTTTKGYPVGFGGLAAGLTLAMIHLATIPVDNTSVNPARSLGTAVFGGSDALSQLWVFLVFPLIGSVIGVLVWLLVHEERLESTMLGEQSGLVAARDKAVGVANQVNDRFQ